MNSGSFAGAWILLSVYKGGHSHNRLQDGRLSRPSTAIYRWRRGVTANAICTLRRTALSRHVHRRLRLFYATMRGGYRTVDVLLNDQTRAETDRVLSTIEEAIQAGRFAAAPRDGACEYCDYLAVCGPYEEERVQRKPQTELDPCFKIRRVK